MDGLGVLSYSGRIMRSEPSENPILRKVADDMFGEPSFVEEDGKVVRVHFLLELVRGLCPHPKQEKEKAIYCDGAFLSAQRWLRAANESSLTLPDTVRTVLCKLSSVISCTAVGYSWSGIKGTVFFTVLEPREGDMRDESAYLKHVAALMRQALAC